MAANDDITLITHLLAHGAFTIVPNDEEFASLGNDLLTVVTALCSGISKENAHQIMKKMGRKNFEKYFKCIPEEFYSEVDENALWDLIDRWDDIEMDRLQQLSGQRP